MQKNKINRIFKKFKISNPKPKGELYYKNTFTLLVAVVLSAQATDKGVNRATRILFKIADNPKKIITLGKKNLIKEIKNIGLFNAKAHNILMLSKILLKKYNGEVPSTREELMTLPGVGRKTANVVLNIAFNKPTIAVDTHLFRLSNRIGIAVGETPLEVERNLLKVLPNWALEDAHHWLILHGRYICKARSPLCDRCLINNECEYEKKFF